MAKKNESTNIYEMKMTLQGVTPKIWRCIHVRSDITLDKLHRIIQITMGWTDSHLHEFVIQGERYGISTDEEDHYQVIDESRIRLSQVAGLKSSFIYSYDFGDCWEHEMKVTKMFLPEDDIKTPICIDGKRACPPEDCGGFMGYSRLLKTLAGPACEDRDDLLGWLDGEFDPEHFDLQAVNKALHRRPRKKAWVFSTPA